MIQIRNNVFETNSSSTHSICISKKEPKIGSYVRFCLGEFGWENAAVNPADYLYTAIMCRSDSNELLGKLEEILDKNDIMYDFEEPKPNSWGWYDFYIDHSEDTDEFIDAVLNDEDMLMRLLFNSESAVYTGNDNQYADYAHCNVADEYMYNFGTNNKVPNPYHDEESFDYFYKGN